MCFPFSVAEELIIFSLTTLSIFSQHAGLTTSFLKNLIICLLLEHFSKSIERCLIELFYFLAILLFLNTMSYLLTLIHFPFIPTFSVSSNWSEWNPEDLVKNRSMDSGTYSVKFKGKVNKWWISSAAHSISNILDISFLWICFKPLNIIFPKDLIL